MFAGLAALGNGVSLALLLHTWKYRRKLQLGDLMIIPDVYSATGLVLSQMHTLG